MNDIATTLQLFAALTKVDIELHALREELGDLPQEVESLEGLVREKQERINTIEQHLSELQHIRSSSMTDIQTGKDREKELVAKQTQVRSNREFDALTQEIETIRYREEDLRQQIARTLITEENLNSQLEVLRQEFEEVRSVLVEREDELRELTSGQDDEIASLHARRQDVLSRLDKEYAGEYERIHAFHNDAAAKIHRGSCSGCYSAVPPQKLVEIRAFKVIFNCEHCGRFIYPEELG